MITQEQIFKVLAEINSRVPRHLMAAVVTEVKATPTIEFVMDKALELDSIDPELKEKIRILKEAGEFSKTKFIDNKKAQKAINDFTDREIKKAIKAGKLPNKKELAAYLKKNGQVHQAGN